MLQQQQQQQRFERKEEFRQLQQRQQLDAVQSLDATVSPKVNHSEQTLQESTSCISQLRNVERGVSGAAPFRAVASLFVVTDVSY